MSTETKVMIGILVGTVVLLAIFALVSKPKTDTSVSNKVQTVDTSGAWANGPKNAPITMVEFTDFQCPVCGRAFPVIEQALKDYNGKIYFVHRHFPLTQIHPNAMAAAEASEAAGAQGKFWEMHDLLFKNQDQWADSSSPEPFFEQYAQVLGLNLTQFKDFVKNKKGDAAIQRDIAEGNKLGVNATPTIFINGKGISGLPTHDQLKARLDAALASASPSTR